MVNLAIASLAFSAGMISFLNPCGFAMLPAYISYYFAKEDHHTTFKRIFQAILIGLIVSLGFMAVYVSAGLVFSYVSSALKRYIPIIGISVGSILIILGIAMLFNFKHNLIPLKIINLGDKLKNKKGKGYLGFFSYGVGYALASMGCTLPIFIMIVGSALSLGNFFDSILVFILYTGGKSLFMIITTILLATTKGLAINYLKTLMKYIKNISAVTIILAGAYIIYFNVAYKLPFIL